MHVHSALVVIVTAILVIALAVKMARFSSAGFHC